MNRLDKTNMEIEILFEHIAKMERRVVELEELKRRLSYNDREASQIEILHKHIEKSERRIAELEELKRWISYSDEEAVQEASKVIAEKRLPAM